MAIEYKTNSFDILGRSIQLRVPADPNQLLEEAANNNEKDPYWGKVWNAAVPSAKCVLRTSWPNGTRALELGCGTGLLGIAALLAGLKLTFTDHVSDAVSLAVENATANSFPEAEGRLLDWHQHQNTPDIETYPVLLASDVLYETSLHEALLRCADHILEPGGSLRIGDPGRENARAFLRLANTQGWSFELFDEDLRQVGVPARAQFQWIVLRR